MSTQNLKDLDALVPEDLDAKLGGVTYTLPGDLPLEIYLRMNKAGELEDDDEKGALDIVVDAMCALFSWRYQGKPEENVVKAEVEKTLRSRGVKFNLTLLKELYGDIEEDAPVVEAEANPQ